MKIGIMSFAHLHAEAYIHNIQKSPGVELVGLADAEASRGRQFAQAYDTHYYPEYPALLEAADAVIICSENVYHRPLAEMAAAAGVHVLCEKPLATTLADAQAIIDACRSAGVTLMTAFPMRFSAPIVQLKQNIDQGNLGKVYYMPPPTRDVCPSMNGPGLSTKNWPAAGR